MHSESPEAGQEHDRQAKISRFKEIDKHIDKLIEREVEIESKLAKDRNEKGLPENTPYENINGSYKLELDDIEAEKDEFYEERTRLQKELWPEGIDPTEELK